MVSSASRLRSRSATTDCRDAGAYVPASPSIAPLPSAADGGDSPPTTPLQFFEKKMQIFTTHDIGPPWQQPSGCCWPAVACSGVSPMPDVFTAIVPLMRESELLHGSTGSMRAAMPLRRASGSPSQWKQWQLKKEQDRRTVGEERARACDYDRCCMTFGVGTSSTEYMPCRSTAIF